VSQHTSKAMDFSHELFSRLQRNREIAKELIDTARTLVEELRETQQRAVKLCRRSREQRQRRNPPTKSPPLGHCQISQHDESGNFV
jgi:hypothetical protein